MLPSCFHLFSQAGFKIENVTNKGFLEVPYRTGRGQFKMKITISNKTQKYMTSQKPCDG